MNLLEPVVLAKLVKIVLTNLVLSGDNALVIALATRTLPPREQFWGRMFGAAGAVGLRVLFVFIVTWIIRIPILQFVAGLTLVWVAWNLVRPAEEAPDAAAHPEQAHERPARSLWHAVWIIIVADIIMSLDNVIAIAGIAKEGSASAHGEMWLVTFGLLVSIPIVIWGSAIMAGLMNRFRWIVWLGGGVLGHVAGGIIFSDPQVLKWMGVPATPGMLPVELDSLLAVAAPWVGMVVHYLPWILGVLLFAVGAWSTGGQNQTVAEKESEA